MAMTLNQLDCDARPKEFLSPKPQYTYDYSQPSEYHFCQDSVLFPRFIAQTLVRENTQVPQRVLDLGAGCGVLGFELAFHWPALTAIDFLEVQTDFLPHFQENLKRTGHDPQSFRWLQKNYTEILPDSYDLIIANPPYFFPSDGKISPSKLKNRCRFFIDASFEDLINCVLRSLKPEGQAFLLVKAGTKHGRNLLFEIESLAAGKARITVPTRIRGTEVVRLDRG